MRRTLALHVCHAFSCVSPCLWVLLVHTRSSNGAQHLKTNSATTA